MFLATISLLLLQGAESGAAAMAPPSAQALAIRNFSLFSHRKLADELVLGEGVYLDTLLTLLPGCDARATKISWLRQVARETVDTDAFADQLARSYVPGSTCAAASVPRALPAAQVEAGDAKWLALLHYRAHNGGSWRSQADRPAFFLSKNGKHAPQDELQANLAAIRSPAYACTFPARYEWLNARYQLGLPTDASKDCPDLKAWYAQFPGQRISINFAASYLENPSSLFGHTFLKVYRESNRELLSPTLNYAARADARVGELEFVRKGLFGGFPGVADELPFYRRLRTYTENEGRDIWEYALNLTPAELRQVLLHLWEVRDGIFDYYFLDENCAYRTLALLDVARPELGLLKQYSKLTVPVETIRSLQASGLLGERTLWPAFPKLVRHHEGQLGSADVSLAARIASGQQAPDSVAQFDAARQAAVLQLAYEYLSVLISRDQAARDTRKSTINAILRSRMALAATTPLAASVPASAPETGHDGSSLSFGAYRTPTRRTARLAWAGFEHTLGDRLAGYEPYAAVTVLRPEIEFDAGGPLRVQRIDWLAVQSTLPSSPLFARPAWRMLLSTARKEFDDGRHLATSLSYNSGRAWSIGNTVLTVMPGISGEAGAALPHAAAASGSLAVLLNRQGADWSAQLALDAEKFLAGSHLGRSSARATASLVLSRNTAIEFGVTRLLRPRPETQAGVAIKVYLRPLAFTE
jgi:hypothetical protein